MRLNLRWTVKDEGGGISGAWRIYIADCLHTLIKCYIKNSTCLEHVDSIAMVKRCIDTNEVRRLAAVIALRQLDGCIVEDGSSKQDNRRGVQQIAFRAERKGMAVHGVEGGGDMTERSVGTN